METPVRVFKSLLDYGEGLVGDIQPAESCTQPIAGMNHPAWLIGHLAFASDRHATFVGAQQQLANWADLFGKGSTLKPSADDYPGWPELLAAWRDANDRYAAAALAATDATLDGPNQGPLADALPTVRDFITFSMTGHLATHLGQLSAWRRATGREPLF